MEFISFLEEHHVDLTNVKVPKDLLLLFYFCLVFSETKKKKRKEKGVFLKILISFWFFIRILTSLFQEFVLFSQEIHFLRTEFFVSLFCWKRNFLHKICCGFHSCNFKNKKLSIRKIIYLVLEKKKKKIKERKNVINCEVLNKLLDAYMYLYLLELF